VEAGADNRSELFGSNRDSDARRGEERQSSHTPMGVNVPLSEGTSGLDVALAVVTVLAHDRLSAGKAKGTSRAPRNCPGSS
jgi:hypothetical protein